MLNSAISFVSRGFGRRVTSRQPFFASASSTLWSSKPYLSTGQFVQTHKRPTYLDSSDTAPDAFHASSSSSSSLLQHERFDLSTLSVGFLGCGKISTTMVRALCNDQGVHPKDIILSPRNAERAASLAAQFPHLARIAADNQQVVDSSDIVFVGLLPKVAAQVLPQLQFRPDQRVVSMMVSVPYEDLRRWVKLPQEQVVKCCPLPPCAVDNSTPVLHYPRFNKQSPMVQLLERVSTPVPVQQQDELKSLMCVAGLISTFYEQLEAVTSWVESEGVDPEVAKTFTSHFFGRHALMADHTDDSFGELSSEAATPGGLNEYALQVLKDSNWFNSIPDVLQKIKDDRL